MDVLKQVDQQVLAQQMRERFEACMRRVMQAVNAAPTGRLIEG